MCPILFIYLFRVFINTKALKNDQKVKVTGTHLMVLYPAGMLTIVRHHVLEAHG